MKKASIKNILDAQYPSPVAVVVSLDRALNRPNITAQGWFMFTSFLPPMLAISIANSHHSCAAIRETGEFVLALPNPKQADAVYFCGTKSGRTHDKFKESGFTPLPASKVKPPLIADACANFGCKVVATAQTGDHTLFVGEVVEGYVAENSRARLFATSEGKFVGHED